MPNIRIEFTQAELKRIIAEHASSIVVDGKYAPKNVAIHVEKTYDAMDRETGGYIITATANPTES